MTVSQDFIEAGARATRQRWRTHREQKAAALLPSGGGEIFSFDALLADCLLSAEALTSARRVYRPQLYQTLGKCLSVCEGALQSARNLDVLIDECGKRHLIIQKGGDVFLMVGRLCFDHDRCLANQYRYASILRAANDRGIRAAELPDVLRENGGLTYLVSATKHSALKLELDRRIKIPTSPFLLKLLLMPDGRFQVLEQREPADGI